MMSTLGFVLQFDRSIRNYTEKNFPQGNVPVSVLEFTSASASLLKLVTDISALSAQLSTGEQVLKQLIPLRETLSGIGLVANVAADSVRLADAIESGDQARIDDAAGLLATEISLALALGLRAAIVGIPVVSAMSLGFLIGGLLWTHREQLFDVYEVLSDFVHRLWAEPAETLHDMYHFLVSPLLAFLTDPVVIDIDGDGVELTQLATSEVHFDYDGDGFAERTGWVSPDDGILVNDRDQNGTVDSAQELFGSPEQDGFSVLEVLDSNRDGKIDESDDSFHQLKVWRDLNQNGVSEAGELLTLNEAGIQSISLGRLPVNGANSGHNVGFQSSIEWADGTKGIAQSIYFQTDRQDTRSDNTPNFTVSEDGALLPQLAGSGQINSILWRVSQNPNFLQDWKSLTDLSSTLSESELRDRFTTIILQWADVESVERGSRGQFVDAQQLAFVEKFFGNSYREIQRGGAISTSPTTISSGAAISGSFQQIVDVMLTSFLAQATQSIILRGGEMTNLVNSPYLPLMVLNFQRSENAQTHYANAVESIKAVFSIVGDSLPSSEGASIAYLSKLMVGLKGFLSIGFENKQDHYARAIEQAVSGWQNSELKSFVTTAAEGKLGLGGAGDDGILVEGAGILIGGEGDDILVASAGSNTYVYSSGDGSDVIRDSGKEAIDVDVLVLTDINFSDVSFEKIGDALRINVLPTQSSIISERFYESWGYESVGVDKIKFADGTEISRAEIAALATSVGDNRNNYIYDTDGDDRLRAGAGDDRIRLSKGSDTVIYAPGDGRDLILDTSGNPSEIDVLKLMGLNPEDVQLERVGNDLLISFETDGDSVRVEDFFRIDSSTGSFGSRGIDTIQFQNGVVWDRPSITALAYYRGNNGPNYLVGSAGNDTFHGGLARDTIIGQDGSDTYKWAAGDGNDTINEYSFSGADSLELVGLRSGDVEFIRRGTSLLIHVKATDEVITVYEQFDGVHNINEDWNNYTKGLERIVFEDGSVWDRFKFMSSIVNPGFDLDVRVYAINGVIQYTVFFDELHEADPDFPRADLWSHGALGNYYDLSNGIGYSEFLSSGGNDIALGSDYADVFGVGLFPVTNGETATALRIYTERHNYFAGRDGDDVLVGRGGHDTLSGGAGNDRLYGDDYSESASNGDGIDTLYGDEGDDFLYGGGGADYLDGGNGRDRLYGGDGNDVLRSLDTGVGAESADIFVGGAGDDLISSEAYMYTNGSDIFIYSAGDGNDVIIDNSSSELETDTLKLIDIDPGQVVLSRVGADLIISFASFFGSITATSFFYSPRSVLAGESIDQIEFSDGTVWGRAEIWAKAWFRGTGGGDYITTTSPSADVFIGYEGDDTIHSDLWANSDNGPDTFVYRSGDGNDIIIDGGMSSASVDTLLLVDLDSADVELSRSNDSVLVKDTKTGQVITGVDLFNGLSHSFDAIKFADGTVWDRARIYQESWFRGTLGKDTLQSGEIGNNTFIGGAGDDFLISSSSLHHIQIQNGDDTFIYSRGDGSDTIYDGAISEEVDMLILHGFTPEELRLYIDGSNLLIKFTTSTAFITDWSAVGSLYNYGIDRIVFDNGSVWERDDIRFWSHEGSEYFQGDSGANLITGSYLDQRLGGGGGNDFLDGKDGSDLIFGDSGNDEISISVANVGDVDTIDGGDGVDTLVLRELTSSVYVDLVADGGRVRTSGLGTHSSATDRVVASVTGIERVTATAFDDSIYGNDADNDLRGGDGNDLLDGRFGNDALYGGRGDDILLGYLGDDILEGGTGRDQLDGGAGDDTYVFNRGDGEKTVLERQGEGEMDVFKFVGVSHDQIQLSRDGNDLIVQFDSSAGLFIRLTANDGPKHFDEFGIEKFTFDGGVSWSKDYLRQLSVFKSATAGDDILVGTDASGMFGGGQGNDLLNGGGGSDIYVYARGDGNDTITEASSYNSDIDKLVLTDINSADATLSYVGTDLTITIAESAPGAGDGGSVKLIASLDDNYGRGVENIVFADGTIWNAATIRAKAIEARQTSGDDTITGFNAAETYTGGLGNDTINGGSGFDTYVYARGDGNDTIIEASSYNSDIDKLVFTNINPADVILSYAGTDLTITIPETAPGAGDGGSVKLIASLDENYGRGVENIVFADGTIWNAATIRAKAIEARQTSGDDTITGFNAAETYTGGRGNDTINGGSGFDTYVYARGDGNDTIIEASSYNSDIDKLVLTDINPADVILSYVGTDLTITIPETAPGAGDGGSIKLIASLNDNYGRGVENIVFADGTIWSAVTIRAKAIEAKETSGDDIITGFNAAETYTGGLGNDIINGGEGNDTYVYARGDGNDVVTEGSWNGTSDKLVFTDIHASDVTLTRNGNDLTIIIADSTTGAGDGGSIAMKDTLDTSYNQGVEGIVFADGTVWTRADMLARVAYIAGTDGNDTITGTTGSDSQIMAGKGDDVLKGLTGSDTYIYSSGDGNDYIDDQSGSTSEIDVLKLVDLNVGDLTFSRLGAHAKITVNSTGHVITLDEQFYSNTENWGIEKIEFADGTVWDRAQIKEASIPWIIGTAGNDTLSGTSLNDFFSGGLGDDRFNSGAGSDTYIYASGDGSDYIDDESGSTSDVDVLKLTDLNVGDLTFSRVGSHAKITINSTGHVITLDEQFYSDTSNWGIEKIELADGTVWDRAQIKSASVSRISGTTGNDTLSGTSLNDVFNGGLGDDRFDSGAGSDIYVYAKGDGSDRIVENSRSNTDVDTLRLVDLKASDVEFSRSSDTLLIKVLETGHQITVDWQFYSDSESWGIEKIEFADGTVWDRAQIKSAAVSRISGTTGNDTLSGTSLNDVFNGGLGDDRFDSGVGSEIYVYAKGDGSDRIVENSGSNTDVDTLRLVDLNASDVEFSRSSDTLLIKVLETGHQITVDWQFYSDSENWGIEKIEFADGTAWDRAHIKSAAVTRINGTSGDDTLSGTPLNDVVSGGLGNDTITTGAGDDVIVFKPNFGLDTVTDFQAGAGSADVLEFDSNLFADFEAVLAAAAQVGDDTVITYDASNTVTLKNMALTSLHDDDVRFVA